MSNKVALITGGASGIGAASASILLDRGWRVAIVDRNVEPARELATSRPDAMLLLEMDVRPPETAQIACDKVVAEWGQIDFLVNCAGVNRHAPIEKMSMEDWSFVIDINLTATFLFMQAAARYMLEAGSGAIVNISSIAGARGNPDRSAYSATKAAIDSITKSGAVGWAQRGVRVNAVAPGFTKTPIVQVFIDEGKYDEEQLTRITPMRRMASPDEIAQAVVFLGSEEASFITGQTLYVDGGYMAEYGVPTNYGTS